MIVIADLTDADIGREVLYCRPDYDKREFGKIRSWNELYIFVDYRGNGAGIATGPEDLEFAEVRP